MWKTLPRSDAANEFRLWNSGEFPSHSCEGEMLLLREKLLESNRRALEYIDSNAEEMRKRRDYHYDLRFGIELYTLLKEEYQFNERKASDDEIWIYLSMKVVPDLVYNRWGYKESRFYKQSRRIWLRTIWWYIHLSWTGEKDSTYNLLKDFTTDEIVQLVERSGPKGYRIDVTREIMKQFSKMDVRENRELFRRIMKLNTARLKIVEPSLTEGGITEYVKELIKYFGYSNETAESQNSVEYTSSS